ncbi:unnamed protein product [Pieris brassicae]|uniref:Uncharacterized protein n=1 Tax=Pieris brassicae TaxID=7116 RepID=A0A9P0T276_PIEBR|nr:unnamed protein product [Pieris brassicae]
MGWEPPAGKSAFVGKCPIDIHIHQRVLRERGCSAAPTRPRAAPGPTQRPPNPPRYPPQALGRNGGPGATRGCKRGRKQ